MSQVNIQQVGARYETLFTDLKQKKQKAFIPFVMIGDPNAQQSLSIIKSLIDAGADALELGIPFSDPSADGLTIQKAALRAIDQGTNTDTCIEILKEIRQYAPNIPIGLLLYGNLVFARGIDSFYQEMAGAGVDSVLIADVPIRESQLFRTAALKYGIAPIFIAPPNASDETIRAVSSYSRGYTYVLSRAGVTGVNSAEVAESSMVTVTDTLINNLVKYHSAPPILGFGISTPEQVKEALKTGAMGAISGSAVVKVIEDNLTDPAKMITELSRFINDMKAATKLRS
jgi:tryptophan synthase alpha chain